MEPQKTSNSQSNLEKKPRWRYHAPWFQTILQSYSDYNSIVLAHTHTHTDQWSRTETPEINPHYTVGSSITKDTRIYNGEKVASSMNGVGKIRQLHAKE